MRLIRLFVISIGLMAGLSACVYDPHYYYPPGHRYQPHYYPYYYEYYYYPGVSVYFQFTTGFYFYYSKNRWIRTKVLPPHIHLNPRNRVKIWVDNDKPYLKHKEHVKIYKPKPRTPKYRDKPPVSKDPIPRKPVWESPTQRQESKPAPRVKPGKPDVERKEPPTSREEREHHLKIFKEHQKKQKDYEKEWKKRYKQDRR